MPSITVNGVVYELPPDDSQAQKVPEFNAALIALAAELSSPTLKKARVYNNANISITTATTTALTFNSERYDLSTLHSTSTNTSRLTLPTAGAWFIGGSVAWAANATGVRQLAIRKNGTTILSSVLGPASSGGVNGTQQAVSTEYSFAVNDYVELIVYQDSGGALNVVVVGDYSPEFWCSFKGS